MGGWVMREWRTGSLGTEPRARGPRGLRAAQRATVAPAAPRPAAKVPTAVAASRESVQEAARALPARSHGPLGLLSFVIS